MTDKNKIDAILEKGMVLADMMLLGVHNDEDMKTIALAMLEMKNRERQLALISLISAKLATRELKLKDGMLSSWFETLIEQSLKPDEVKREMVRDTNRLMEVLLSKKSTQPELDAALEALLKGRKH